MTPECVSQVNYRFTPTVKIQMWSSVATNVTWQIREQSVKKRLESWQKNTGMYVQVFDPTVPLP